MFEIKSQMSESILIGGLLTFAGGFMDSYSYICRGNVFANAQTGNIVLVGINLFNKDFSKCILYLIPILSFVVGIMISEFVKYKFKAHNFLHWRQIIIITEILGLFIVGFIPQGTYNTVANVLISFVCSLQVHSFRKINGLAYSTTMCTGNLRSATENLCKYGLTKDKTSLNNSLNYYGIILIFILGASVGSWITNKLGIQAIWLTCIVILIAFILMLYKPTNE